MKTKTFDCVEMKRQGSARLHEETKGLSFEEKVAFWEKKNRDFEVKVALRRAAKAAALARSNNPGT